MRIRILTIFPELFTSFLGTSLIGRALAEGRMEITVHDLRDFTDDSHKSVDDEPYGGGGGMVMTAQPWLTAVRALESADGGAVHRVLLSPQGRRLDESGVRSLAEHDSLILLCGRYEGIDERVRPLAVDEEVSIGDYVLSGGEVAAMVVVEAISRQLPGVVGLQDSVENDSFRQGLLDYPHYTRPRVVEGLEVPDILLGGHHAKIQAWRHRQALEATLLKRPDLLAAARLDADDHHQLEEITAETGAVLPSEWTDTPRVGKG